AQAVATRLMIECCGAAPAPGPIDVASEPAAPLVVRLREARVQAILGVPVALERQAEILRALDFASSPAPGGLDVTVPALRRDDVTREVDLIEEVARIDGVDRLPATLPARRGAAGMLTHAQRVRRAAEDAMAGRGLHEIVGWSFAEPELLDRLLLAADHPMRNVVRLENPLSDAQSIMRPTLLGSLMDAAQHNVARNGPDIAIFESGTVYRATAAGDERAADEHHGLGVLLSGSLTPRSWRGEPAQADFFAAKALLAALLDQLHVDWSVQERTWPFLHPGRSAVVRAGGQPLGFVGELHPLVAGAWDLERTAAFAIDVGKLAAASPEAIPFTPFPAVPSLRQDLAVVLPDDVAAAQVLASAREAAGELLADVNVFDVYAGEQVGEGRRSLALALSFRAPDRTLTEEDVAPARERIVVALGELGGELRG
ncbi:MAG: phenylalanyl-tRNA synthetase beta chain, partial [Solirubrobacteraceae bacterium]|nr:phenylalanyl-tRNA synthetase beta chain [Solirubrobacteraceae bacterium]